MATGESSSPLDAATALGHVRDGRSAAARRVATPWWYHPRVGLTLAALFGSGSLDGVARAVVLLASVAALAALFWLYRRLTGVWVDAYNVPGTRSATTVAMLVALGVLAVANVLEHGFDVRGSLVVAGVLLGVAYVLFWRWVERRLSRLWQSEL
jgi:hypothetical protein